MDRAFQRQHRPPAAEALDAARIGFQESAPPGAQHVQRHEPPGRAGRAPPRLGVHLVEPRRVAHRTPPGGPGQRQRLRPQLQVLAAVATRPGIERGGVEDQQVVGEERMPARGERRRQGRFAGRRRAGEGMDVPAMRHRARMERQQAALQGQRAPHRRAEQEGAHVAGGGAVADGVADTLAAFDEETQAAGRLDQHRAAGALPGDALGFGVRQAFRHRASPDGHVGPGPAQPRRGLAARVEVRIDGEGHGAGVVAGQGATPSPCSTWRMKRPAASARPRPNATMP